MFIGRKEMSEFAVAAVDIAMWDLFGKRTRLLLCELLGGTREPVTMDEADSGWLQYDADQLVENARSITDEVFAGMPGRSTISIRSTPTSPARPTPSPTSSTTRQCWTNSSKIRSNGRWEDPAVDRPGHGISFAVTDEYGSSEVVGSFLL